ncbi:TRAP transporter small permease [Pseudoroseomonas cervicalis]|uniref:TRAP transporter small permease protein n=1 Tax=Pseudoroseomonas cervicalis ATCC 49957 TaxID=525371 RepID=D5RRG0_9PROT|nr:TRAP transporter small permease subunit [Pseudoroseomonas cervicalis]EFH10116.1 TRAP transporter, DctQ-like membrane protein [Pseudoroseomonas cervicalis ATCC 49957]
MNTLPLQVIGAASLLATLLALWIGARAEGPRRVILALDRVATELAAILAVLALAVAACAGLWQVIARFATETPSIWSEALVRTALIWMAMLGLAVALRAGSLVSIDAAHRYSGGGLRRGLQAASLAANLSLMGVLFWFGWSMAQRVRFQEMAGLEVSMSWGYAAIPVGALFAMIGALAHFLDQREAGLETAL